MDLETENRLAALLMEEARRLRREAEKDGVHIYLQKPNVRGRPNSRFLTATVLGVEQANRAAEISEMWRAREKECELDAKQRHNKSRDNSRIMNARNGYINEVSKPWLEDGLIDSSINCSSSKYYSEDSHSRDGIGLQDDDIEEFLHSRVKRGRGSVGCRMDEPGPYLPSTSADLDELIPSPAKSIGEEKKRRILGPEKPYFFKSHPSHEGEATDECKSKKYHYEKKKNPRSEKSDNKSRKENSKYHKNHRRDSGKRKTKYV
ncbi:uncharacterized protein LOC110031165 [Phalaenopsis equestris]|uniref:uncharacterized protein LOC110031165 n=1 Tax=Phalaenopsis equestris TaxID=78828 RepID=UPI0009E5B701|nr:uncharacterized protein LOC110031165 [Phalaenopsis equestris]